MTKEDIDKLLELENQEVIEAHIDIISIQKDKNTLLKLGIPWADENLIAGLNNKIIFFGTRPGGGKTFNCSRVINNLLDRKINPTPIKVLRANLEMPTSALLLRELSKTLGKKPSEILSKEYTESERPKVQAVVNSFRDNRIQNISIALEGTDYKYMLEKFISNVDAFDIKNNSLLLTEHIKEGKLAEDYVATKTKKIVLTDHIHVYLTKATIDNLLTIQNEMKMKDKNLSFINYFQLNRETEEMWMETKDKKVNPKNMLPSSKSIYLTDMLQMYSDMTIGAVIPQVYELDEFAVVNKERNEHLREHFVDDDNDNKYSRLKGRNRIYYNLIKVRMIDDFDDPRVFCEILSEAYEEKANKLMNENKNPFSTAMPSISFGEKTKIQKLTPLADLITPPTNNFDLASAFDIEEKELPF
jgi:hypothetical protein